MVKYKTFTKSNYVSLPKIFTVINNIVSLSPNTQIIDLYKTYFRYIGFSLKYISTPREYNNDINQESLSNSLYKLICDPSITDQFITECVFFHKM